MAAIKHKTKLKETINKLSIWLIVVIALLVVFNQWQISGIASRFAATGISTTSSSTTSGSTAVSSSNLQSSVIPTGVPRIYGAEFGLSYDDISSNDARKTQAAINKMGVYDKSITLTGDDLQRYIAVGMQISCEYCCGAEAIIFKNGAAACGCAHSGAMRGLAKYLISKHPNDFTNDEILEELGKWKTLFFPGIMTQKAAVLQSKGIEFNYINLASNKYRGIEKGATSSGGAMVGGC
ncbi:MAG: hypothetical protein Q7J54_04170 [Candidatus Woesearchaeota archaeon]|nr:hypothetical protein [Candidatus Woesearchaeota archaeon]